MPTSLFIEQHDNGCAFYINGDLQFDTADEALYHEYLVIPAIALFLGRFPNSNLRVLICGGGDGLAARDVLRFKQVSHIDLVDFNPEVLELGRTVFKPYNCGSLENVSVTVHIQEAFEFVSAIPDNSYHVVICDFTYPTCAEETSIYSREWFQQVNRILHPGGVICTNGVSPETRPTGFWCLYQTLLSAQLIVKPLQLAIPSFRSHGYGNWGFFLASPQPIEKSEIEVILLPDNLQTLTHQHLVQAFVFKSAIALDRHNVNIHTLECPQLYYYLLNALPTEPSEITDTDINFLDIEEIGSSQIGERDLLQLESVAQYWIEQIYTPSTTNPPDMAKLLPVRHHYHSPKMTAEWLAHLQQLLAQIDGDRLVTSLLKRAQELPPQLTRELKQLSDKIRSGQPSNLPPKTSELIMILSVTLLMANLVTPDAGFAKGSYYGSSGYSGDDSYDGYYSSDINISGWKILGFILSVAGANWLYQIVKSNNESSND